jgi:hypothetical protein
MPRILILLGLCVLLAAGCGSDDKAKRGSKDKAKEGPISESMAGTPGRGEAKKSWGKSGAAPRGGDAKAMDLAKSDEGGSPTGRPISDEAAVPGSPRPREAMAEEAMAGGKHETPLQPTETPRPEPQSGLLTAGSFDDNLTPRFFDKFVRSLQQSRRLGQLPQRFTGQRL